MEGAARPPTRAPAGPRVLVGTGRRRTAPASSSFPFLFAPGSAGSTGPVLPGPARPAAASFSLRLPRARPPAWHSQRAAPPASNPEPRPDARPRPGLSSLHAHERQAAPRAPL